MMTLTAEAKRPIPFEQDEILVRIRNCPRLPSLRSIDTALKDLLRAEHRYTAQISNVIRRDPSLTARLLRLVNSVYYSLTSSVSSIEEAVFYLGVRQIRQLAMVTPVIEDFQKLASGSPFPWRDFWQHCVATAILTREIANSVIHLNDDSDYVSGLIHDVGKIVMASAFPAHFQEIYINNPPVGDLRAMERDLLGMDHAELGAIYLKNHHLSDSMVDAARFHHDPPRAGPNAPLVAAVHIADLLARYARIGNSGNPEVVEEEDCMNTSAWNILFENRSETEIAIARGSFNRTLEMLPSILSGML